MHSDLHSIRMRATRQEMHISGAERIVPHEQIDLVSSELRKRALSRMPKPDRIVITIESLAGIDIPEVTALPITSLSVKNVGVARMQVVDILEQSGVARTVAQEAIELLDRGASPTAKVMRGAVLMSAHDGKRLEPDQERGVRVSRFDWTHDACMAVEKRLNEAGLGHFRTKEALALATKVARAPGVIAELCWSDDPEYPAGYIASHSLGYIRFPALKPFGSMTGGRVFFIREQGFDLRTCIDFLERQPVLISGIPSIAHGDCYR